VTALTPPAGIEVSPTVKRLREVHGMVVAGGQDKLKGRILRIGHMGHYDRADAWQWSPRSRSARAPRAAKRAALAEAAAAAWESSS
jgi:aspartate aminotransferase-like enzyme